MKRIKADRGGRQLGRERQRKADTCRGRAAYEQASMVETPRAERQRIQRQEEIGRDRQRPDRQEGGAEEGGVRAGENGGDAERDRGRHS